MDLYNTLGVSKDATQADIKAAYRKLAQQHHPDKEGGDKEKFQAIQQAYAVLGDEDKRAHYDEHGTIAGQGPTPRDEAMGMLVKALNQVIMQCDPDYTNILQSTSKMLKDTIAELKAIAADLGKKADKVRKASKRVSTVKGKDDSMSPIMAHLLASFTGPQAQAELQIKVAGIALDILKDHQYEVSQRTKESMYTSEDSIHFNDAINRMFRGHF